MGYKIVAVNPLRAFPIVSFKLANVVSLEDARTQIFNRYKNMAQMRIDANDARVEMYGGGRTGILSEYQVLAKMEFEKVKVRWPKIAPALEAHLARQARRLAHFKVSCRVAGCADPHRQKRGGIARATKAKRPSVRPLFCGPHAGVRRQLTREAIAKLHANSANRVEIAE